MGGSVFMACDELTEIITRQDDPFDSPLLPLPGAFPESPLYDYQLPNITLFVPIGAGYAYRHHPYFRHFKEIKAILV